jgi:hypothetical protein
MLDEAYNLGLGIKCRECQMTTGKKVRERPFFEAHCFGTGKSEV